jgi:hypothetical protein
MAFRADEAAQRGYEQVLSYLVPRPEYADESVRKESREFLVSLIDELGPVVDAYPSWHPLVSNHEGRYPETTPREDCGYKGLDHTRLFAKGFITCPYSDGQKVIDSVDALPSHPVAAITAERLDVRLYNPGTTPILVKCNWDKPLLEDGTIPQSIAVPYSLKNSFHAGGFLRLGKPGRQCGTTFSGVLMGHAPLFS